MTSVIYGIKTHPFFSINDASHPFASSIIYETRQVLKMRNKVYRPQALKGRHTSPTGKAHRFKP